MSAESDIRKAILEIAKSDNNFTFIANVDSVDIDSRTCDVTNIGNELEYTNVMLQAYVSHSGIVITPKINSQVLVTMLSPTVGHVTMYSEVDIIALSGEGYGGIVKADTLKTELDKTNALLNAVVTAFNNWTPTGTLADSTALKALITPLLVGKSTGDYSDIKNNLVKHGNGIS
jgi:hypothetical protein